MFPLSRLLKKAPDNHQQSAPYSLLLLRFTLAGLFLYTGFSKWTDPTFAAKLPSLLMGYAQQTPFFFYEDFLRHIATPNAGLFALLISIGELTIGSSLLFGFCVQAGSLLGIFLTLNYLLASMAQGFPYWALNLLCLSGLFSLLLSPAGQTAGLDQLIRWISFRWPGISSSETVTTGKKSGKAVKNKKHTKTTGKPNKKDKVKRLTPALKTFKI